MDGDWCGFCRELFRIRREGLCEGCEEEGDVIDGGDRDGSVDRIE